MSPKEFYKVGHFIRTKKDTTQNLYSPTSLRIQSKIVKIIGKNIFNSLSKGGFNKITQ